MAEAKPPIPSVRFAAIFSQQVDAIDWACRQAEAVWGETLVQSPDIDFDMTTYYDASMGGSLKKRLVAFRPLVDPATLIASKNLSNHWEQQYRAAGNDWAERPVNI